jgi:hypothetical protein
MVLKLYPKINQMLIRPSDDRSRLGKGMNRRIERKEEVEEQQIDEERGGFSDLPMVSAVSEDHVSRESSQVSLDALKEQDSLLLAAEKQFLGNLVDVQVQLGRFAEERGHLLATIEKNLASSHGKNHKEAALRLFLIESSGSKFTDGLVFTVMAEDRVWAEDMVRQWLDSNGRETDKIDKVQAIVSHNVRAIVGLGSKLLDR